MSGIGAPLPPSTISGSDAVLRMRDEFLLLVAAYNAVGEYFNAADAQIMVLQLTKFEDDHNMDYMVWPPCLTPGDDGPEIVEVER